MPTVSFARLERTPGVVRIAARRRNYMAKEGISAGPDVDHAIHSEETGCTVTFLEKNLSLARRSECPPDVWHPVYGAFPSSRQRQIDLAHNVRRGLDALRRRTVHTGTRSSGGAALLSYRVQLKAAAEAQQEERQDTGRGTLRGPRREGRRTRPGRNGSGRGPDADRTRGARWNSNKWTWAGHGPDAGPFAPASASGRGRNDHARVRSASGPRPPRFRF
eukprot:gene15920-biopygen23237